ncbi:MAG: O-methyltransferase [Clostridia bacterium]|nr:O-methyltransferase [Clostridia bacterium]
MFNNEELERVKLKALEDGIPIIMDETLEEIKKILINNNPKRILEIGTAVGYSAIQFAKYAPEAIIDSIELNEQRYYEAKNNINNIGVSDRINLYLGNAVDILPTINFEYDIVFIDANKGKYPYFLKEGIRLVKANGYILADNILFKGYVLGDYNKHKQRTAVRHLREYIKESMENEILETKIIHVGDGLAVTKVNKK